MERGLPVEQELAAKLMELFFIPGSSYYQGPVNVAQKTYTHVKGAITLDRVLAHINGEVSIGAPSSHNGMAKWVAIDIDSPDPSLVQKGIRVLRDNSIAAYASFSGRKGYHLIVFYENPVPLPDAQRLSGRIKRLFRDNGIPYDKISPAPTGKGGDCLKLPLGIHPETGKRCNFLDDNLDPVENLPDTPVFISAVYTNGDRPITTSDNPNRKADPKTGEITAPSLPQNVSTRPCINRLWRDGLQARGTRHSATCTIANAVVRSPLIPPSRKEEAIADWVMRTYPRASNASKIDSDLEATLSEAKRLLHYYLRFGPFSELCENQVFKSAMRSACKDELQCKLEQNRGHVNFNLLRKVGIFNASNAKPKGIGKTALSVYLAIEDISSAFPLCQWDSLTVFSLSTQQLVCQANCTKPTAIKQRNKLLELGLLKKVPDSAIPIEVLKNRPRYATPNFYALPELTEQGIRAMLERLRGYPEERG